MTLAPGGLANHRFLRDMLAVAAILALIWVGLRHAHAPGPLPITAPVADFSAARGMSDVVNIARVPHPMGTEAHGEVRQYLLGRIKMLGYLPEVQEGTAVSTDGRAAGLVRNIVVRVAGTERGKALMLVAHYDSAPASPGAADDGASVAAILETLRALKSGPRLRNDLICLLTDGEEAGSLGAQLFTSAHPYAKDVALVLNFEFRGNAGPVWMFETSAGNGKLIDGWAAAVPSPIGNSLLSAVYGIMPNSTDLTSFKKAQVAGLNFAAADGHTSYHSQLDRADTLDETSLQHEGDIMLSLTRHFGNLPLADMRGENSVYFDYPGLGLIHYPVSVALPFSALLAVLWVVAAVRAVRGGQARAFRIVAATAALAFACVALALAGELLWLVLRQIHSGYRLLVQGSTYNALWYLAALSALSAGLFALVLARLQRHLSWSEITLGALLLWTLLSLAVAVALPEASFLFTWPMPPVLAAVLYLQGKHGKMRGDDARTAILLLAAAPGIVMFGPVVRLLFVALTPMLVAVALLALLLFLCLAAPLLQGMLRRFMLPALPLAAAAIFLAGGALTSGADEQHPLQENLYYVQDSDGARAYWVSEDDQLDAWETQFFHTGPEKSALKTVFGVDARPMWAAPAAPTPLDGPSVKIVDDETRGDLRRVVLEIRSIRAAPRLRIYVDSLDVQSASVQGLPVTRETTHKWSLETFAMGAAPVRVEFSVKPNHSFSVRVRDISYGLPKHAYGERPVQFIVQPFFHSNTTQLSRQVAFGAT